MLTRKCLRGDAHLSMVHDALLAEVDCVHMALKHRKLHTVKQIITPQQGFPWA